MAAPGECGAGSRPAAWGQVAKEPQHPAFTIKAAWGPEYQVSEMVKNRMQHNLAITIMTQQFHLLQAAISEKAVKEVHVCFRHSTSVPAPWWPSGSRMNAISSNLANITTPHNERGEAEPYQPRFVVFQADASVGGNGAAGVKWPRWRPSSVEPRWKYEPGNPLTPQGRAAQGQVAYPNIDMMTEFTDALEAARALRGQPGRHGHHQRHGTSKP